MDETDLTLLVGQLQGGFREVKQMLIDQNAQHERDKQAAIQARQEKESRDDLKHAENQVKLQTLDEKATLTGSRVAVLEKFADEEVRPVLVWYRDEGSRLGGRTSALEQARVADETERARAEVGRKLVAAEKRGSWKAWALIGSAVTAAGGMLIEYGSTIMELLKSKFHG